MSKVSADEAQVIVQDLVTRTTPVIQDFNGHLKVLNSELTASDHCLVLLYHRGVSGATFGELRQWVRPPMRANLKRTLYRLVHEKDLLYTDDLRYYITRRGQIEVESRRLVDARASI